MIYSIIRNDNKLLCIEKHAKGRVLYRYHDLEEIKRLQHYRTADIRIKKFWTYGGTIKFLKRLEMHEKITNGHLFDNVIKYTNESNK